MGQAEESVAKQTVGAVGAAPETVTPECPVCGGGRCLHGLSQHGKTILVVDSRPAEEGCVIRRRRFCKACRRRVSTLERVRPGELASLVTPAGAGDCATCQNGKRISCQSSIRVTDSRPNNGGKAILRRHHCTVCGRRYSSLEEVEIVVPGLVVTGSATMVGSDQVVTIVQARRRLRALNHGLEVPRAQLYLALEQVEQRIRRELVLEITQQQFVLLIAKEVFPVSERLALRWLSWFASDLLALERQLARLPRHAKEAATASSLSA